MWDKIVGHEFPCVKFQYFLAEDMSGRKSKHMRALQSFDWGKYPAAAAAVTFHVDSMGLLCGGGGGRTRRIECEVGNLNLRL